MMFGNFGYGMGFGGGFFMIVFLLMIIVCIVYVFKALSGAKKEDETALDILKKRYAKGEIDKEEFEAKKRVLQ